MLDFFVVVPRGFEPRQTEPKPVVLPLHHRTILGCLLLEKLCKDKPFWREIQIFSYFITTIAEKGIKSY